MLKWREVESLPKDHPKMLQFIKEQNDLNEAYLSCDEEVEEDESSLEYFDRYIAGDRK